MAGKYLLGPAMLFALTAAQPAAAISHHSWDRASSIAAIGLGATALAVPVLQDDWSGTWQAGGSMIVGGGIAYGLKSIVHENRPDGSGNDSFPSAHTALAFSAAATLENRYGWEAGLPAMLVATFVGVARVQAKRHHWYDAVAGAAIGTTSGFLITSKHDDGVRLVPWGDSHGGGVALGMRF